MSGGNEGGFAFGAAGEERGGFMLVCDSVECGGDSTCAILFCLAQGDSRIDHLTSTAAVGSPPCSQRREGEGEGEGGAPRVEVVGLFAAGHERIPMRQWSGVFPEMSKCLRIWQWQKSGDARKRLSLSTQKIKRQTMEKAQTTVFLALVVRTWRVKNDAGRCWRFRRHAHH